MNRDDIIRMAWEAGFQVLLPQDHVDGTGGVYVVEDEIAGMLERFAALVAAAEREACISIIESHRIPVGNSAAGEMACEWTYDALHEIRDAIRARGEK